jgi:hypothetical protein
MKSNQKKGQKEMKIRHFLLLVVVLVSFLAVGCTPARSTQDYLASGGRGEVAGKMNGVEFSAVIEISEGGDVFCIEYLSPSSLCGLVVRVEGEVCKVKLGEVCFTCGKDEVAGFLRPVSAFLPHGDAKTVQKEGEKTVLTFSSGGTLTLSPKGEPLAFICEDIDVRVVWWERGESAA